MDDPETIVGVVAIFVGAFLLMLLIAIVISAIQMKRRTLGIREWAFRNGFDYVEGPVPAGDLAPIRDLTTSDKVTESKATNILRGSRGVTMTLFDLQRTTRNQTGRRKRMAEESTAKTCALFKLSNTLPQFWLMPLTTSGPEAFPRLLGGATSLARAVSAGTAGQPIEIKDRPGFLLLSHDPSRAAALFDGDRARFFDDKCGWNIDSEDGWLLVSCDPTLYRQGGWKRFAVVDAPHFDDFVSIAVSIQGLFTNAIRHEFASDI